MRAGLRRCASTSAVVAAIWGVGGEAAAAPDAATSAATTTAIAAEPPPGLLMYDVPRASMIPGTPGMPGGFHFMLNAFAEAQNAGLGAHRIENSGVQGFDGGATYPLLVDDWVMASGRDAGGWVEGLLMLDFEPVSVGAAGYPELGQSGEGLWDAQHAHQLLHQAMIAVHPLAGLPGWHPESMREEGPYDLSFFGGQGSATIGPPVFMHRGSSPGPTVPRKHHKGENPHETFPVLGASLRLHGTWLEASAFSDLELTPQDSRFYPHVAPPESFAARVRQDVGGFLELQLSAERLRDQGHGEPDAYQVSASAYGWGFVHDWRLDMLVDWALDAWSTQIRGGLFPAERIGLMHVDLEQGGGRWEDADQDALAAALDDAHSRFDLLEWLIAANGTVTGEFTIADCAYAPVLWRWLRLPVSFTPWPKLTKLREALCARPTLRAAEFVA